MANENKNALKNALDRLAAAIKNKIGGEAVYPFTIEEMCNIADGTMPVANEGEKGKEGFFYYMGKMADCIAEKTGAELPLSIDEMIDALGGSNSEQGYTVTGEIYTQSVVIGDTTYDQNFTLDNISKDTEITIIMAGASLYPSIRLNGVEVASGDHYTEYTFKLTGNCRIYMASNQCSITMPV